MTRIRWTDNASRGPLARRAVYTFCSGFAICSFALLGIITLTKHPLPVVSQPPHVECEAGASEITVTREMRDVGASLIEELRDVVSASGLAERVYISMARTALLRTKDEKKGAFGCRR